MDIELNQTTSLVIVVVLLLVLSIASLVVSGLIDYCRLKYRVMVKLKSINLEIMVSYHLAGIVVKQFIKKYEVFLSTAFFTVIAILFWAIGVASLVFFSAMLLA